MITYGKTWWGQKWLDTFNGIDAQNRLARGRTYANTGRAGEIEIKGNVVAAKVRGSQPRPYKVKISFKMFDQGVQEHLKKIITDSPLILSQLLNKKMPPLLINTLEQADIKLFPSSWREIEASCSCPDWAIPCKHIASVIYLICNQIDRNPFVLFEVHNCDLLNLIAEYQDGRVGEVQRITLAEDLFKPYEASEAGIASDLTMDLSKIPNLLDCIITILENNPPFYDKNFRDVLGMVYKYWQKHPRGSSPPWGVLSFRTVRANTQKEKARLAKLSEEELFLEKWDHPEKIDDFYVRIDEDCSMRVVDNGLIKMFSQGIYSGLATITFLKELPNALLHRLCPKIRFLYALYQYATILLERSAIIPQLVQNKQEAVFIRWIPALFDTQVKDIYIQLCDACPKDFVVYNDKNISPQEQVKTAISWLIFSLIEENIPSTLTSRQLPDVLKMFVCGQKLQFKSFADKEIPGSINQWLAKLYLSEKSHKLYLKVEESKGGFELIPQILLENAELPISIKKALQSCEPETRLEILSDLSLIADYVPGFDAFVQTEASIQFSLDDFAPLFLYTMPALRAIGVIVVLPKSLHKIFKPSINLALKSSDSLKNDRVSFLVLDDLLEFDWKIAIGDQSLSIEEFKKMLKQSAGLVKMMDQYVLLDEKEVALLLKKTEKLSDRLSQEDLLQAILAEELDGATVSLDAKLKDLLKSFNKHEPVLIPHNLKACLRPYQERGFNWLVQNIRSSFGSILADDMGLGKTIQVIAVILYLKNQDLINKGQRVLIVAPTGLLSNWEREFKKFAPDITTCVYHGNMRKLPKDCDVIITSYGLARSDKKELSKMCWFLLVVDEAQNIKNPSTEQTKSIKSIPATHKIAMSGTPVENRLLEYWSIFDFTNKLYLGTLKQFKDRYAIAIEKERDKDCLDRFKKVTSPFILRRLKSDKAIIADLPDKIENNRYCALTPEQTALYQKVVDVSIDKVHNAEGMERRALVFQLVNALKQICNHPAQFVKKQNKISVEQSGKMVMLEEILTEIDNVGEKCLIFTQYVEMGDILVKLLAEKMKIKAPFLHGGISRKARDNMVNDFQDPMSNTRFFIISLKAGGTGLNLTAANHVIHYDLWWNPAVESQATDRAYRIGQKRNVIVHRFITTGTFEERIDEMIQAKKELASLTVGDGEQWITEMSTTEIRKLVELKNLE